MAHVDIIANVLLMAHVRYKCTPFVSTCHNKEFLANVIQLPRGTLATTAIRVSTLQ
jgi:hypothetical protein